MGLPPFNYISHRKSIFRWYESSVPWGHLNDEGETEPEDNDLDS